MTVTGSLPFPFITKEGSLSSFKTTTTSEFNNDFAYGDAIIGSYPYTTKIFSDFYPFCFVYNDERKKALLSLKNTLNYYGAKSNHYSFSSSLGDKETQQLRLISIPSIFYGQSLKKGSVTCKWYYSGSLMAELRDTEENGELRQIYPSDNYGKVAGVALYKEGFIILTGSWNLHGSYQDKFDVHDPAANYSPAWKYFLTSGSSTLYPETTVPSSSFLLDFEGVEKIPVMTMLAKAEKGEYNYSNNPTFIKKHDYNSSVITGSNLIKEREDLEIKNIVSSSYEDVEPPFEKITYISKVAIYDKDKNLIGVAKLANPVAKKQNENIGIKIKLDM
jgi:hypothetical protein